MRQTHGFPPFFDKSSEILILGSFPSVKSRGEAFYYAHPQNRFWRVLALCFGESVPQTLDEKKSFLTKNKIALWDVIESCEIVGSSDSSIRFPEAADIASLLGKTDVKKVILNGKTAERWFLKFYPNFPLPKATLPSTSPANASWSVERLAAAWKSEIIGEV